MLIYTMWQSTFEETNSTKQTLDVVGALVVVCVIVGVLAVVVAAAVLIHLLLPSPSPSFLISASGDS